MLQHLLSVLFFLTVHVYRTRCELTPIEVRSVLQQCQININTSLELHKNDKLLVANWSSEFQIKQVNITSHYRLQMIRHREHSFRKVNLNAKWNKCLRLHNNEIRNSKTSYYEREGECLILTNSADRERRKTVSQVEKELLRQSRCAKCYERKSRPKSSYNYTYNVTDGGEEKMQFLSMFQIKKWRKSYKYLSNLCEVNNPDNKENADCCLAEYIKRDNYDSTFERLILLKLEAMSDLLETMNKCLSDLEDCLRRCLSENLQNIRTVMEVLGQCYNLNKENK